MINDLPAYLAPITGFRSRKAAQVAAFFAVQQGGVIEKLKLMKLIYMSERLFLKEYRQPMLFDELYSLPHGPICSSTLNGIDGKIHAELWDAFIARNGNQIVAMKKFSRDDFDEISDADMDVLTEIWSNLGSMTPSQIRNYTHDMCDEYTEIESGRLPISYREVFEALGNQDAEEADQEILEMRRIEGLLQGACAI